MRRFRDTLALAVILGVAVGSGVAAVKALAERYPQQGLHRLTLHLWLEELWIYLPVALAGGCIAWLILATSRPLVRRSGRLVAGLAGLGAQLALWLPAAVCVHLRDPWLLPADRRLVYAGYMLLAVLLAGLQLAARRRRGRRAVTGRGRALATTAALCLMLTAAAIAADRLPIPALRSPETRPNILLIVLDTVRRDRLSAYGYSRPTTTELDAFAEDAIRYTNFYATSCWTVPSHASLFTGLYPIAHRATQERVKLDARFATLAEILRNAGYQTWGASGNPWMSPRVNLSQGFQTFIETWRSDLETGLPRPEERPHPANAAFERFLERSTRDRPFFAFINYMDAHTPYAPPEPYPSLFLESESDWARASEIAHIKWNEYYRGRPYTERDLTILSNLYDAAVAYLSSEIGRLLRSTKRRGLYDDTLILITADHGEHFGENHLLGHAFGLYNTTVRIPLMIRLPGGERAGELDHRKGQLVDLFSTILNAAGVDPSAFAHRGVDLLAPRTAPARESIFSEYYYPRQVLWQFKPEELERQAEQLKPYLRRLRAIERYGHRLIWSSNGRHELYDLNADPGETRNLLDPEHHTEVADEFLDLLTRELETYVPGLGSQLHFEPDSAASNPSAELDDETLEALRAVGYVR
jgi:arylsulfatase A-like enzyme